MVTRQTGLLRIVALTAYQLKGGSSLPLQIT